MIRFMEFAVSQRKLVEIFFPIFAASDFRFLIFVNFHFWDNFPYFSALLFSRIPEGFTIVFMEQNCSKSYNFNLIKHPITHTSLLFNQKELLRIC